MFYPHSSNNVLSRDRPMECECIWLSCKNHLSFNRHYNWNNLDNKSNPDNNTDIDILDYNFNDKTFEILLKKSIKMLLLHRKCKRFIWKNPINGFRIGYIKKIFPDAKFIHIARNPAKTTKSQIIMEEIYCKAHYLNIDNFRKSSMKPHPPYYNNEKSWYHLYNTIYPNDMYGHLLWPRVWPRTKNEHYKIQQYLKKDMKACATAMGIVQHERVVLESFNDKKLNISVKNGNLLTIWHEDVLSDPLLCLKQIHKYLELDCDNISDKDRIKWLEIEDFPNGKANPKRVKQSSIWEKGLDFGNETDEVYKILEPCFQRYKKHMSTKNTK